jgi:hypothetical protein
MGMSETIVRRMLDPDTATKTRRTGKALSLAGKRLLIAVKTSKTPPDRAGCNLFARSA